MYLDRETTANIYIWKGTVVVEQMQAMNHLGHMVSYELIEENETG